jgi:hypothetical protein
VFEEAPRERRQPRIQQQRALEGRIVLLGLLGIAVVTALGDRRVEVRR